MRRLAKLGPAQIGNSTDYHSIVFSNWVDHFSEADPRIFYQRSGIQDTYYKPGGPIFFMMVRFKLLWI